MIGGLLSKSVSRLALVAVAGLFVGGVAMPSAKAADLGGDCCADLEERVAELEATTARKGNRKMSLTITGQVHKMILWWDDGLMSRTYYGVENRNSSTRLSFLGSAKVTPDTSIGFEIMLDNQAASSAGISQFDPDGKNGSAIGGAYGIASFTGNNADNYFGAARRMAFWVENAKLGRITVGHYEMAGAVTTIDLGGISAGASASMRLVNGNFNIRGPAGQYYGIVWTNITDFAANQSRQNEVRYDSPSLMGFILTSSIGNDGSNWGTMLRYAGEFNGFRLAAGIGYEHYGQLQASASCPAGVGPLPGAPCPGPVDLIPPAPNVNAWGAGLSVMHVPTGLFAQGHYIAVDFDQNNAGFFNAVASQGGAAGFWSQTTQGRAPADQWLIQGGIAKNWFGIGNTAIFAEYSKSNDWGAAGGIFAPNGRTFGVATIPGGTAVAGVTDTGMTMYGLGITQNVDAAATEFYLDGRHFSADITCHSTGANCTGAAAIGSPAQKLATEDFWAIIGGARVRF
jgi:hypothetical protein